MLSITTIYCGIGYICLHKPSDYVTGGAIGVFWRYGDRIWHILDRKDSWSRILRLDSGVDFSVELCYSSCIKAVMKTRWDIICPERRLYAAMALHSCFLPHHF